MTPTERAEKIFNESIISDWTGTYVQGFKKDLAAQIAEAEREASIGNQDKWHKAGYEDGFSAARERAKEIAETYVVEPHHNPIVKKYRDTCMKAIADRIAAMEPEGK